MDKIKKNFGFGLMSLPMNGEEVNIEETKEMVDAFLNAGYYYNDVHTSEGRKASDCIKCGKCEKACPQHLPIRKLLADVAEAFEKDSVE